MDRRRTTDEATGPHADCEDGCEDWLGKYVNLVRRIAAQCATDTPHICDSREAESRDTIPPTPPKQSV
jgi:hypothetical protein